MIITRDFFGLMVQGGTRPQDVPVDAGTFRIWNWGASFEWVYRNDWQGFEAGLAFAKAKNMESIYVLAGENTTTLPSMDTWKAFVAEAVTRAAGRIRFWEPWNEPVYARAGAELLRAYSQVAREIIKAAQPDAVVLTPSFNELLTDYGWQFASKYLSLPVLEDVVTFHSYDGATQVGAVVARLREVTAKPLWDTETATDDLKATFINHAMAGVERTIWNGQVKAPAAWWDAYNMLLHKDLTTSSKRGCGRFNPFKR
jgi:hypothetical protein